MNEEWIDLTDLYSVAMAQTNGWDIEALDCDYEWFPWIGVHWAMRTAYRGRPKQPKKITVTSECWRQQYSGELQWRVPEAKFDKDWKRFPAGDITGEVEA